MRMPRDAVEGASRCPPWLQTVHRMDKATEVGWHYWCALSLPACGAAMIGLGVMATRNTDVRKLLTKCALALREIFVTHVVPCYAIFAIVSFILWFALGTATGRYPPSEAASGFLSSLVPSIPTLEEVQWVAGAITGFTALTAIAAVFGTGAGHAAILISLSYSLITATSKAAILMR